MIDKAALVWSDGTGYIMSYPGDEGDDPILPPQIVFLHGLCQGINTDLAFVQEQIDWNTEHLPPSRD